MRELRRGRGVAFLLWLELNTLSEHGAAAREHPKRTYSRGSRTSDAYGATWIDHPEAAAISATSVLTTVALQ